MDPTYVVSQIDYQTGLWIQSKAKYFQFISTCILLQYTNNCYQIETTAGCVNGLQDGLRSVLDLVDEMSGPAT